MIRVYYGDCSPLFDRQKLTRVLPLLNQPRRTKTLRYKTAERRAQSAGAGLMLRHLFGDAEYAYGENGKPYLKGRDDLYFSLSHSDRYVVCAVADCEVGVDIEPVSSIRPAVLRRCFTSEEQDWIGTDPERFIRLWTMKEAYMKLTGTGISVPAKDIPLPVPPADGLDAGGQCCWSLLSREGLMISLCSQSSDKVEMIPFSFL